MRSIVADNWLAEVIGRPAFKVQVEEINNENLQSFSVQEAFYYARILTRDISAVSLLAKVGFYTVDTNVTMQMSFRNNIECDGAIRKALYQDITAVANLAGRSFKFSRFHLDPKIKNSLADNIKVQWAKNYFLGGRGDQMLVAEFNGEIVGFLQLIYNKTTDAAVIDLIAVDERVRGRGIGKKLIAAAGKNLKFSSILVGTQIANIASLGFYENLGFRIINSHYIMHLHR